MSAEYSRREFLKMSLAETVSLGLGSSFQLSDLGAQLLDWDRSISTNLSYSYNSYLRVAEDIAKAARDVFINRRGHLFNTTLNRRMVLFDSNLGYQTQLNQMLLSPTDAEKSTVGYVQCLAEWGMINLEGIFYQELESKIPHPNPASRLFTTHTHEDYHLFSRINRFNPPILRFVDRQTIPYHAGRGLSVYRVTDYDRLNNTRIYGQRLMGDLEEVVIEDDNKRLCQEIGILPVDSAYDRRVENFRGIPLTNDQRLQLLYLNMLSEHIQALDYLTPILRAPTHPHQANVIQQISMLLGR